jgi:two-component system, chemotaxis family, CheB/CheR fusion protein
MDILSLPDHGYPSGSAVLRFGRGSSGCPSMAMIRKQKSQGAARRPRSLAKRRGSSSGKRVPPEVARLKEDESNAPPFLVAGVGASAGGLEALTRMLEPIAADSRLAIVLVQHLSRTHKSLLAALLAAKTSLRVKEAHDAASIEPGTVYVIRPDTRMTVIDGSLRVVARPASGIDAPVDRLFESLAEQYKEKAIGIVLSGSGHDGAAGSRLIKAAGGIVIVQEPTEAQVDGMPRAAISGDGADLVVPAHKIAAELMRLSRHPFFNKQMDSGNGTFDTSEPQAEYRPVFQMLRRTTGVDFTHYKPPTIRRRVQRRMALHRLHALPEYVKFLQKNPTEVESLHDDILIHVTGFFREPESFTALTDAFREIVSAHHDGTPIRAWVPGCSSGEEAYSLAISLLEFLDGRNDIPLQVFGTDVSQKMIDRARSGVYHQSSLAGMSPERLRRFFSSFEGGHRVTAAVRERCVFARQDITRDPPFSKLDIILCRNLLIYLGQPLQRRAVGIFHYALNPHGYLMLGRSETVGTHGDLFSVEDSRWKIYRRKSGSVSTRDLDFGVAVPLSVEPQHPGKSISLARQEWDVQGEANRLLLDRHAPPSVIVDEDSRIVRARGRTSRFLELPTGDASLDALKMVRAGLLGPLRTALLEARQRDASVRKESLRLRMEDGIYRVALEVTPLGRGENRHYLIQFESEKDQAERETKRPHRTGGARHPEPVVKQLEDELGTTRQHLQSMIQDLEAANEELQSANEEILSSNEELQSTNEELDTAREELQSTNEALSTVNDELQSRNAQLMEANSDLVNLLASVQIAIVMVSSDLRIRRFTPAAERALNLIASDVGRPIGHLKPNIRCPDLESMIREVVDLVSEREREVQDNDGNTFILRIRPYKSVENRIEGAVLVLFDVSTAVKLAREMGEAVMSRLSEPALLLDGELKVQRANRAFYTAFQLSPRETEGVSMLELDQGNWNLPGLRELLENVLPTQKAFEGFPAEQTFARVGKKKLLLDARRIESDRLGMILLVVKAGPP